MDMNPPEIIDRLLKRYENCTSYQDEGSVVFKDQVKSLDKRWRFRTFFSRPDSFFFELSLMIKEDQWSSTVWSHNNETWFYSKSPASGSARRESKMEWALQFVLRYSEGPEVTPLPIYAQTLLLRETRSSNLGFFDNIFTISEPELAGSSVVLLSDSWLHKSVKIKLSASCDSIEEISIEQGFPGVELAIQTIVCKYENVTFDGPIPEAVFAFRQRTDEDS